MLGVVLVPGIGVYVSGARRWINIGFTNFQPSELAKIFLIVFFARFIMKHEQDLNEKQTIIKAVILIAIPLALIVKEPDLSTTICVALVFCLIMYVAGLSYRFIGTVLLITVPVAVIFLSLVVQPNQKILSDYQQKRILAWLEPEEYASDEAYQQNNSVMAIGSVQLTGKGLNNNTTTSLKNGNFILEPQTDFIFAIIGEELGFLGCIFAIVLLLLIVIQCILIGRRAQNAAGKLICCGVGSLIGVQTFINIAVATQIFPNTGIPLPFVSYGLTSLVSLYVGIGLVLNVSLQPRRYQ
jgi:rod shape determining protein RodA